MGLVGVLLAFASIGGLYAFQQPPFVAPDETAHLGYAHEIASLRLPEIDRAPDRPGWAVQWEAEADSRPDDRYRGVWVANHPPLNYVLTAPLIWAADLQERPDGGLLYLRLANVLFAAVGVALTYLLGIELSGGIRRIGLAAAAVAALVPQGHIVFSQGLNDGLGYAAGTAIVLAGVRCLRRGIGRRELVALGAAGTAAIGARAATMLLAVVVVGFVAAVELLRAGDGDGDEAGIVRGRPWSERIRAAALVVGAGLVPGGVLLGWYYVRNIALYGDIGASDHLLRLFRRRRRGSVAGMMTRGSLWVRMYQLLESPSTLRRIVPPGLTVTAVVTSAGAVAALVVGRTGDRGDDGAPGRIDRRALGLGALSVLTIAVTLAQHVSGGGNGYPRYMFPALGVLAAFAAIGLDRLVARILPVVLVFLMGWWALLQLPVDIDPTRVKRPRDDGAAPALLQVLPVGDGWRTAAGVGIVIGVVTAGAVLLAGVIRPGLSTRLARRSADVAARHVV